MAAAPSSAVNSSAISAHPRANPNPGPLLLPPQIPVCFSRWMASLLDGWKGRFRAAVEAATARDWGEGAPHVSVGCGRAPLGWSLMGVNADSGDTPLGYSVVGTVSSVRHLLHEDAEPYEPDNQGPASPHMEVQQGICQIVELLLSNGGVKSFYFHWRPLNGAALPKHDAAIVFLSDRHAAILKLNDEQNGRNGLTVKFLTTCMRKEVDKEENGLHVLDLKHDAYVLPSKQSNEKQLICWDYQSEYIRGPYGLVDVKQPCYKAIMELSVDYPVLLIKSQVGNVVDAFSPFEGNLTKRVKISALQQIECNILAFKENWVLLFSSFWGNSVWLADIFSTDEIELPSLPHDFWETGVVGCFEKDLGYLSVCLISAVNLEAAYVHTQRVEISFCYIDSGSESWTISTILVQGDIYNQVHCPLLRKDTVYWVGGGDVYSCSLGKDIKHYEHPGPSKYSLDSQYNLVLSDDLVYMVQTQRSMVRIFRVDEILCPISSIDGRLWFLSAGISGQLIVRNANQRNTIFIGTGANRDCLSFKVDSEDNEGEATEVLRRCLFSDACFCSSLWVISSESQSGWCFGNIRETASITALTASL
ncbi:hypothetical protein ACP70R_033038 [Stipagrostis hirtigluma subsp. patula]